MRLCFFYNHETEWFVVKDDVLEIAQRYFKENNYHWIYSSRGYDYCQFEINETISLFDNSNSLNNFISDIKNEIPFISNIVLN
jgi:hypothetical protein